MTIKELRDLISRYEETDEVRFTINDHYSQYGEAATPFTGSMLEDKWWGTDNGSGGITLSLHLNEKDGKNPKITYRN